ncbi:MAG: alpha/beta hydrolase [Nitriliruptoraceae bacterium]|nr:alpha/beta hydrolase [Nitriliruptoraceae bacterium]
MGRAAKAGLFVLGSLVLLTVAGLGIGGWIYSGELLPAPAPWQPPLEIEVAAVDADANLVEVVLPEEPGLDTFAADDLQLPTVGLVTAGSRLVLHGPVERTAEGLRREGILLDGEWPRAGDRAGVSVDTFYGSPDLVLGLPYERVDVPGDDGTLPAWRVVPPSADTDTWVVIVHGRGGALSEGNRLLPVLDELGLPSLTVSVRNDPDAPADPDGFGYYGSREWEDLAAAIDHLVAVEDAERIVLAGYSQGGSIALSYLRNIEGSGPVEAAVLVSPLVSLGETLVLQAQLRDIPDPIIPPLLTATRLVSSLRAGFDVRDVEHVEDADELPDDVPMLVTHGSDDRTVPVEPSRAFAARLGDQVRFEEYEGAGHVREWNVDRDRFEADLRDFLTEHVVAD